MDSFPKNQRFIFGQRLADRSIRVLEILVDASYQSKKADLLAEANRQIEVLRWLVRLAKDRQLLTMRQYGFACKGLTECGRMVGGWLKKSIAKGAKHGCTLQNCPRNFQRQILDLFQRQLPRA